MTTNQPTLPDGSIIEVDGVYVNQDGLEWRCVGKSADSNWVLEYIENGALSRCDSFGKLKNTTINLTGRKKQKIVRWFNIFPNLENAHLFLSKYDANRDLYVNDRIACIRVEI